MKIWSHLCVLVLIWLHTSNSKVLADDEVVEIINATIIARPAFPIRFTATIMMVIRDPSKQVKMAKEFYDALNNRSAMIIEEAPDVKSTYIFDFRNQKHVSIDRHGCNVDALTNHDDMFFGSPNTNKTKMSSARQMFDLIDATVEPDEGEINGIKVRTWKSTQYYPSMRANVTVEASFAISNWTFPHCYRHGSCHQWVRPVLLKVKGTSQFEDLPAHDVDIDYYFLDYIDDVDPDVFVPPAGLYCDGYPVEQPETPFFVDAFSMEQEMFLHMSHIGDSKTKINIYYDASRFVLREDSYILVSDDKEDQAKDLIEIKDGRNGVNYRIDGKTKKCISVTPFDDLKDLDVITPGQENHQRSVISIYDVLVESKNLLNFSYVGQRNCRLGRCEVWASVDSNSDKLKEIYFKKGKGSGGEDIYIPVQLTGNDVKADYMDPAMDFWTMNQHFFNYQPTTPDWTYFDITECYEEKNLLRFQVVLEGPYKNITSLSEFIQSFQSSLQQYGGLLPLRSHKIMVDNIENRYVTVTATLTEDPKVAGILGTNEDDVGKDSNINAYNLLVEKVSNGEFIVQYMDENRKPVDYTGISITKDIISESKISDNAVIMQEYDKVPELDLLIPPALSSSLIPIDECAKLCNKETTFQCESFTYCHNTGTCKMFRERRDQVDNQNQVPSTGCSFYGRNYTYDYAVWEKVKMKLDADEPSSQNLSLQGCLSNCALQTYDNFACRSVDVCRHEESKTPSCYYHKRHMLEVPRGETSQDDNCLHFSRKYISEFAAMVNSSIDNDQFVMVPIKATVEFCATSCATDPEGCTDFEMCTFIKDVGDKTECTLMRPRDGATNIKPTVKNNTNCDHYRYKGVKDPIPFTQPTEKSKTDSDQEEEGFSAGEMAGLAIGTLILGGLLGAATIYFVARRMVTAGREDGIVMKLIGRQSR